MTHDFKLAAILVVAGPSTRLGQPKQLVEWHGETLARRSARLLSTQASGPVVAVTGCERERVQAEFEGLAVQSSFNPEWELGMGGSIAHGARKLPQHVDGVLVGVCDQWLLNEEDLKRLVASWREAPDRIHVASWQERTAQVSGPPVIFPGRLKGDLKGLDKRRGARQIIDLQIDLVNFVELPSAAHDLDRPEDLELLRAE
ncbi:MAG: nucleotidyltransferase family protein [Gammaproteobacteria bacterium]|nr:nucleotidyltransferase family protein [Gammaproteobacteria bacterium]MBT8051095.1 nucleotidyltransferase family protein [Gammaproteobacteria bacterium]MBT8056953.1 nucleotidyltransferase family protein [Gammaproteobacteria bacterium]NNJ79215.1 nucleotidyltransferase family protein [Xanthomonadales bacterium]NNK32174.1 nucleotidyltransferase family protein [Xanthomonadales bacterium]